MNHIRQFITIAGMALMPWGVLAQAQAPVTFADTLTRIRGFLNQLIPFAVLVATLIFLWGVVRYITAGGDEERVKEARNLIFWGVVFLAVMIGLWGFVNIVLTFVFTTSAPIAIPGPGGGVPCQPPNC